MAFRFDTTRSVRTASARRDLARAVRDAAPVDVETDWLEWKTALDLADRGTHFEIARQVLGFANRDPDRASRIVEGCAYFLIGVSPQELRGVTPADPADLEKNVNAYVGSDGPAWDHHYEDVEGTTVLIVTVEAPRWGDTIHPLRREYRGYKAGALLVRHAGRTQLADPGDIALLTARARRTPNRIMVAIEFEMDTPVIPAVDDRPEVIHQLLDAERSQSGTSTDGDEDTDADFDECLARRRIALPGELLANLAAKAPLIRLRLMNRTDRNLRAVQVHAQLRAKVIGATDFRYQPVYTTTSPFNTLTISPFQEPPPIPTPRVTVDNGDDGLRLYFQDEDLRPRYGVLLEPFRVAAAGQLAGSSLTLTWYATATDTDGVAAGELVLPVQHFLTPTGVTTE